MGHRDLRGLVGGFAAVVLITHLWMLPANDDRSSSPHHGATTVGAAATTDAMPMAACPVGMSACTATGVEEPRLPQVAALTTSPALLWVLHVLHRRLASVAWTRATRPGPGPPQSPVSQRVLLLE